MSRGRDNNLTLLRLAAATAVVYGHAFSATGRTTSEPFYRVFGVGTGDIGVDAFFVVSGFLIAKSFASKDLVHFVWARVMRIFPALWVSSVILVAVVGLMFSPLPAWEFWLRHDTLTYLAKNATMLPGIGSQTELPFAFSADTIAFNPSLWTLPHELQMYMLLAVFGVCGLLRRPLAAAAVMLLGGIAFAGSVVGFMHILDADRARFLFFFFAGTTLFLMRDRVPMLGSVALACVFACAVAGFGTANHVVHRLVLAGALPYLVMWLSFVPGGFIRRYNRVGDYSYGTYILAGPIQIALVQRLDYCPPLLNFGYAMLIVIPLAALSWHLLESRALSLKLPKLFEPLAALAAVSSRK